MPVCHKRKLAFCHIPRTGGVSVCNALGMSITDRHFPASWFRKEYHDYKLFTVKRNYEDRIQSTFGYKVPPEYGCETMENLITKVKNRGTKHSGLMLRPDEYFLDCEVDFTIRFEYLEQDLNTMLTMMGHDEVKLIKVNSFK